MIVPFGAGLSTDVTARLLVQDVAERSGISFVVEDRPGAGGNIGTAFVARGAMDGKTLLYSTATPFAINPFVYRTLPYDPEHDFAPIARTVALPLVLAVSKQLNIDNLPDFAAYLKETGGRSSYSSYGVGTSSHIAGSIFARKVGAPGVLHVPYKDSKAIPDLIANRNTYHIDAWATVGPLVKAGKLVALGVSGSQQVAWAPTLPTIASYLKSDFDLVTWQGVFARQGTAQADLDYLNAEFNKTMAKPSIIKAVTEQGYTTYPPCTPAEFAAFVADDRRRWEGFVKQAGIEPT